MSELVLKAQIIHAKHTLIGKAECVPLKRTWRDECPVSPSEHHLAETGECLNCLVGCVEVAPTPEISSLAEFPQVPKLDGRRCDISFLLRRH